MAAKRSSSNYVGDQRHGEEDKRSGQSKAKLPRLHSSDGEKCAENPATDQEPQAAAAGKRSSSDSGKEPGEVDTDSGVSEAKKRKVADDSECAADDGTIQDAIGTERATDASWQAPRDGKESAGEDEGREQRNNGEVDSSGEQKENNEEEQEVGMEEIRIIDRDQLQYAIAAAIFVAGLTEDQEGGAGQEDEGGGYGREVMVQTDGGGYAREEVVENDEGEQTAKEAGREDEGNANANVDIVDEDEEEHAKEQEKKEDETGARGSDEWQAREEEKRDVTEQRKEEGKGSEEDEKMKKAEKEGDKGEKGDEKGSGEEDRDKAKDKTEEESPVPLVVTYSKQTHVITLPLSAKVSALKEEITERTGVQPEMQKLCYKGAPRPLLDNATLRDSGLSANTKILLVGCTVADLYAVMTPAPDAKEKPPVAKKLPFCKQEKHKNIIDDGVPEDAIPGILNANDPLPAEPLKGMLNEFKQKVRLTFKFESDELWISTREDTDKIKMNAIYAVVTEPIEKHEEYHIMGLRVGPMEKLSIWIYIYWVPAQFVQAIKDTILG